MTATLNVTAVDRFVRFLETGDDPTDVIDPDVFVDLNVPHWRLQLQGVGAITQVVKDEAPNGATITVGQKHPTPSGFVIECAVRRDDHAGKDMLYREVFLVELSDERITEIVVYCTGGWDADTQKRQAAEAPMIRA